MSKINYMEWARHVGREAKAIWPISVGFVTSFWLLSKVPVTEENRQKSSTYWWWWWSFVSRNAC
jgi:hypothetical protein